MPILDDTRSDWNARPPLRPLTRVPWSERVGVSWHWIGPGKGPSASGPHSACLTQVNAWQRYHQSLNWKDLGYNVLVCQHARAIEGRGLDAEGSHSPGVNVSHVGVQFMVGENGDPPTPAMLARAVRLRADIGALGRNIRRDWAHKDDPQAATGCPGSWITNWVHSGGPTTQEDDVSAEDVARLPIRAERIPFSTTRETIPWAESEMYQLLWGIETRDASLRIEAQLAALTEAVSVLANSQGVNPDLIAATVAEKVEARLAQVKFGIEDAAEVTP